MWCAAPHAPGLCCGPIGCVSPIDWRSRALAAEAALSRAVADADAQIVGAFRGGEARGRQHGFFAGALVAHETAEWSRACARLNENGPRHDIVPFFMEQADACELVAARIEMLNDELVDEASDGPT